MELTDAHVLGQLLFLQSVLDVMPGKQGIIDLVCDGLKYVPGVVSVTYLEKADAFASRGNDTLSISVNSRRTEYGEFIVISNNLEAFAKYKPHIQNVANTVAVTLDNRGYIEEINQQRKQLEQRVNERTAELEKNHAELQQRERQLRIISDHAPVFIAQCDDDKRYKFVNQSYAKLFGLKPADLIGKQVREILGEKAFSIASPHMDTALAGQASVYDLILPGASAESTVVSVSYSPEYDETGDETGDESGNVIGFIAAVSDITERKRIEQALQESEQRFRALFEQAGVGVSQICSDTGAFIRVNQKYCDIVGYSREEVEQLNFQTITHPDDLAADLANMELLKAGKIRGFTMEKRYCCKDGSLVWVSLTVSPMWRPGESPSYHIAVVEDISARKQSEALAHKLSQAIEQAGESILIADLEGAIEYVNPAFEKMTGYSAAEAIGQTPAMLNSGNHDAAFYAEIWRTISRGSVWKNKVIDRKKDGTFFPCMLTISPLLTQTGDKVAISHYVGIQSDLSKIEDLEKQFQQAQKMEALGTLVGGIAHDFNNMLAGITGNLYLAKKHAQTLPYVLKRLDNVEMLSFRSADMIKQLLTFARKDNISMKQFPLTPFIKETLKFLRTSVPENIDILQNISSEDLLINGDATQLHQVLMNLINNARDALENVAEPHITVRLEPFHAGESFIKTRTSLNVGDYAHLSVEDNGCGISRHQIEHLFEPFFTTKELGKGTGLGLAMVFGAIKTHDGYVEVESDEGKGSTFHIYMPLIDATDITSESEQVQEAIDGHGETILFVDDAVHILETSKAVLESLSYHVLTAADGQQAIEMFETHAEDIDLIILDMVMPVMGGVEAAQAIRRINPDVKVIFSTGYDKDIRVNMDNETMLSKPFTILEMSRLIRQKLDS